MSYRFLFAFVLISGEVFAQNSVMPELTIAQIDSLSLKESCNEIYDWGYVIKADKTSAKHGRMIAGQGYGGWGWHTCIKDSAINALTHEDKRKPRDSEYCVLIRADYLSNILFEDSSSQHENIFLYYRNDQLFYVTYDKISKEKNRSDVTISHHFFLSEVDIALKGNPELKALISRYNDEVLTKWRR